MGGLGGVGWLETDNWAISVQLNLTETATGTELGKTVWKSDIYWLHTSDAIGHDLRKVTCTFHWRVAPG